MIDKIICIKDFYDSDIKCCAILVDWVKLNKVRDVSGHFLVYMGNYMSDDSTDVFAVFKLRTQNMYYCVQIS